MVELLAIDAMNLIRRIYAAQQGREDALANTRQLAQNAIIKCLEETAASHVVVVFDGHSGTWRHTLFPAYKSQRKPMPEDLAAALQDMKHSFAQQGITSLEYPHLEADDVIASLAYKVAEHGGKTWIISTDKGFLQLASEHIVVRHYFEKRTYVAADVVAQYGIEPHQLVDYYALVGDTTNEVPGVSKVGPKTASQLLNEYGDLDNILIHSAEIGGKVAEHLEQDYKKALLARKLIALKVDCQLGINLQQLRYRKPEAPWRSS